MQVLYKHSQKREENRMMFEAKLHGAKFSDEETSTFVDPQSGQEVVQEGPIFKDPKEYEHMSDEEKEVETKRMMGFTKRWARTSGLGT